VDLPVADHSANNVRNNVPSSNNSDSAGTGGSGSCNDDGGGDKESNNGKDDSNDNYGDGDYGDGDKDSNEDDGQNGDIDIPPPPGGGLPIGRAHQKHGGGSVSGHVNMGGHPTIPPWNVAGFTHITKWYSF
jgi:hypothetical protein